MAPFRLRGAGTQAALLLALAYTASAQTCNTYTCNAGFVRKATAAAIACTGAGCSDAVCCDATCTNTGWAQCAGSGPGFIDKAGAATINCGATAASCTTTTCCDATCANAVWGTCVQGNGFTVKANINTIPCPGAAATCSSTLCCDYNCAHPGYTCNAGFTQKANPSVIVCGNDIALCTDNLCCDATCDNGGFDCGAFAGSVAKANQQAITCGPTAGDCTPLACCDAKCNHPTYSCPAGFTSKANQAAITCGPTSADCTSTACCDATCDVAGFTCGAGFVLKTSPAPAAITCGATGASCTNTLCCDVKCSNAGFTCGAGFVSKGNQDSIVCGASTAQCSDALCCDAACDNAAFNCGSFQGAVAKVNQGAITCGATAGSCTQSLCCDSTCAHPAFACAAGFVEKVNPQAITCGAQPALCTNSLCCDVTCSNSGFVCSAGFVSKPLPATIACGPSVSDCSNAQCCDYTCSNAGFSCPAGFTAKGNQAAITCGPLLGDCTAALCCDVTCSNGGFACSPGFTVKPNAPAIVCGAAAGDCTSQLCCDVNCGNTAFACSAGFVAKTVPAPASIICGPNVGSCSDNLCCDATCTNTGWTGCTAGFVDKTGIAGITCGPTVGFCNNGQCCDATCLNHVCSAGFMLKPNYPGITCGANGAACTDAICCDVTCSNPGYTCAVGFTARANAPSIPCGTSAAQCTEALCCDTTCDNVNFACGTGWTAKANQPAIVCGTAPADCTNRRCCDATCANAGFACEAGSTPKPQSTTITCGASALSCTQTLCCNAVLCGPNQKVMNRACVACEPGSTNAPNDDASGPNTACDAIICGANEYVQSNQCRTCPLGSTNSAGDAATGPDTFCDVTLCLADQYVLNNNCQPCPPGTVNGAGDRATGPNTRCDAVLCAANQRVQNNVCVACGPGAINAAGDDSSGGDTQCSAVACRTGQRVESNACVPCPLGTSNAGGDLATGGDTQCDAILCGMNQRVELNTCQPCPLGTKNDGGDDASGPDTLCDPILCGANQRVFGNACAACQPGSTNAANDDASGPDTMCDPILCKANQRVEANACTACPLGSTNKADDDATGPDTFCDATLCAANERVLNNMCVTCNPGATNLVGDDATGPNTFCDVTFCKEDQRVQGNVCLPCAAGTRNRAGDPANGPDTRCTAAAGVTLRPQGIMTTEDGGTATVEISLASPPFDTVTFAVRSSDEGEGKVSRDSLTFGPSDWGAAQTVTVTGVQDAADDGDKEYRIVVERAVSSDVEYNGLDPGFVRATNMDDDTVGVTVAPIDGLTTTEAGGTATFGIRLHTQPTADVSVSLTSTNPEEGTVSLDVLVFKPDFTMDGQWWGTLQTITVTGQDDVVQDGHITYSIVTSPARSEDPLYEGVNPEDVTVKNLDDDRAGVTATPSTLFTTEAGGVSLVTIQLVSRPRDFVDVQVGTSDVSEGIVDPAVVRFEAATWDIPQTVTVRGVDDAVADGAVGYNVSLFTVSGDANYGDIGWGGIEMVTSDDDASGIDVVYPPMVTAPLVTHENGSLPAVFMMQLRSEPLFPVTLAMRSTDETEGVVTPSELVVPPANWATALTATITGQNDDIDDERVPFQITFTPSRSEDPAYNEVQLSPIDVVCHDDDRAGVTVSPTEGLNTTEAGGSMAFTVRITTEPTTTIIIPITVSDHTEAAVDKEMLVWEPVNWRDIQTVQVTGVQDTVDDGDVAYSIITGQVVSMDPAYALIDPPNVNLFNVDDDTAGITVSPTSGLVTTEAGGVATFNITLASQPTAEVVINLFSSDSSEGQVEPSRIVFAPDGWQAPRMIRVIGVQDSVDDGDVTFTITYGGVVTQDPKYAGLVLPDVMVMNKEDDVAGITVDVPAMGLVVREDTTGSTAFFSIVLNTQPVADVTIAVRSSDVTEATTSPASLTFRAGSAVQAPGQVGRGDWNTPHTITVTGVDDMEADGNQNFRIEYPEITSDDTRYNAWPLAATTGITIDNDNASVVVSKTEGHVVSESGLTSSYTMRLATQPMDTVNCDVTSSDPTEAQPSVSRVVFTTGDWNIEKTVGINGVDDNVFDGDVNLQIVNNPCRSNDLRYNGFDPVDVAVVNLDVDSSGAYLLTTLSLPAGSESPETLCQRAVADSTLAFNIPQGYITECKADVSSPTDAQLDIVTYEVYQVGPKVTACDKLFDLANIIDTAPTSGTQIAGRPVMQTTTNAVGCPRQYCSGFPTSRCISGRLVSDAAGRACPGNTCDALTCCHPGNLQVALYTSSSCDDAEWIIRQVDPTQVCQPIVPASLNTAVEYGAFYCDTSSGVAYVRSGFGSQEACGNMVGSVSSLITDPETIKFSCDCRRAAGSPVSLGRQCVPLIGSTNDHHAQCGAVGSFGAPAMRAGDDDDELADWEWWLIGLGIALFILILLLVALRAVAAKKGATGTPDNEEKLIETPPPEKDAAHAASPGLDMQKSPAGGVQTMYAYSPALFTSPAGTHHPSAAGPPPPPPPGQEGYYTNPHTAPHPAYTNPTATYYTDPTKPPPSVYTSGKSYPHPIRPGVAGSPAPAPVLQPPYAGAASPAQPQLVSVSAQGPARPGPPGAVMPAAPQPSYLRGNLTDTHYVTQPLAY